jgi:hypothetical protein
MPVTQELLLSSSCLQQGYHNAPHGAHRACTFQRTRLSSFQSGPEGSFRISRTSLLSLLYSLFPFPVYRTLLRSFEYYGNSVTMRLSTCRRSRICMYETS